MPLPLTCRVNYQPQRARDLWPALGACQLITANCRDWVAPLGLGLLGLSPSPMEAAGVGRGMQIGAAGAGARLGLLLGLQHVFLFGAGQRAQGVGVALRVLAGLTSVLPLPLFCPSSGCLVTAPLGPHSPSCRDPQGLWRRKVMDSLSHRFSWLCSGAGA